MRLWTSKARWTEICGDQSKGLLDLLAVSVDCSLNRFEDVGNNEVAAHLVADSWCRHRMLKVCLPQSAIGGAPLEHGLATATWNPPNHLAVDFQHQFSKPVGTAGPVGPADRGGDCGPLSGPVAPGMVIRFPNPGGTAALLTKESIDHAFGRQQTLVDRARDATMGLVWSTAPSCPQQGDGGGEAQLGLPD